MIGEAVNRPTMVTKRIIMFQVSFNLSMMMMLNVFSTSRRLPAAVVALPTVFLAARQLSYNSTTHTHTPTHTQHTHTVRRHVWPVPAALFFRPPISASGRFRRSSIDRKKGATLPTCSSAPLQSALLDYLLLFHRENTSESDDFCNLFQLQFNSFKKKI